MPTPKYHSVYVVRYSPNGAGCGHQHTHRAQAWNCAENIARRRKTLAWIEVIKVSMRTSGPHSEVVGRVTQHRLCTKCKGYLFIIDGEERGHYEDCPTFADDYQTGRVGDSVDHIR